MKKILKAERVFHQATNLWQWLKDEGGLDVQYYDKDIIDDLRILLHFPYDGDLTDLLNSKKISVEEFLICFFQAIQPFSFMMGDLLKLFEKANAKRSNENLIVKFDFERQASNLNFNLSHFKKWLEIWKEIEILFIQNEWNSDLLWMLNKAVSTNDWQSRKILKNKLAQSWLDVYIGSKRWPNFELPPPQTGQKKFDEKIKNIWQVWSTVVDECAKYGADRSIIDELWRSKFGQKNVFFESYSKQWPIEILGGLASDHWPHSMVYYTYYQLELLDEPFFTVAEKEQKIDNLIEKIDSVLVKVPKSQMTIVDKVKQLESFLSLPVWKRRHELYSAWISTQIINAIGENNVSIHQVDGVLEFSFSGTHLSSFSGYSVPYFLWTELRSPIDSPLGKGRKKAIQPDYSLITAPIHNPKSSVLEVECKQYRKESVRNFKEAVIDYANGRPNAQVVLVNYGAVTNKIIDQIPEDLQSRTHVIGDMRPGNLNSQNTFQQIVRNSVYTKETISNETNANEYSDSFPGYIKLTWRETPSDLDLYLKGEIIEIFYSNSGSITEEPWIKLKEDIRFGYGPEQIEISKLGDGNYLCAVNNFSKDTPLSESGAIVQFTLRGIQEKFECPTIGKGDWWLVFEFNGQTGRIKNINKLRDSFEY